MKNFLIASLTAALLAAAVYTRPTEASFHQHLAQQGDQGGAAAGAPGATPTDDPAADGEYQFADRLLWVDVTRDGKPVYSGAFAHWYPRKPRPAAGQHWTEEGAASAVESAARAGFGERRPSASALGAVQGAGRESTSRPAAPAGRIAGR